MTKLRRAGLGGIGKTALVEKALHDMCLIDRFDDLIWADLGQWPVTVDDFDRLHDARTLMIVDNADAETATALINQTRGALIPRK